jgi:hypothetical protein
MRVHRQDYGGAIKKATPTAQGGLRLDAYPTRTGVLQYMKPDGSVTRELRHPDEVFKPESLDSMRFAPLTDLHPQGRVDATNYRELSFGHVGADVAPAPDGVHVAAPILVQDAQMLGLIDGGKRKELSMGYSCDLDETPGEYEGERYDAAQQNIIYNHVAALPPGAGRAGPTAAFRVDGRHVDAMPLVGKKPADEEEVDLSTLSEEDRKAYAAIEAEKAALQKQLDEHDAKKDGAAILAKAKDELEKLRKQVEGLGAKSAKTDSDDEDGLLVAALRRVDAGPRLGSYDAAHEKMLQRIGANERRPERKDKGDESSQREASDDRGDSYDAAWDRMRDRIGAAPTRVAR